MTTPAGPPRPASTRSPSRYIAAHKPQLAAGAIASVAGVALVRRRSAGRRASTAPSAATTAGYAGAGSTGGYSSSVNDFYDAIQPTLGHLQSQLDQLTQQGIPTGATRPTPPPLLPQLDPTLGPSPLLAAPTFDFALSPQLPARPLTIRTTATPRTGEVVSAPVAAGARPTAAAPVYRPAPPARRPAPAAPQLRHYVVRPGDNLTAIAQRFGVSNGWQGVFNSNRGVIGRNPNLIRPGQTLVIPR